MILVTARDTTVLEDLATGPGGPAYDGPGGPACAGPGKPCYAGPGVATQVLVARAIQALVEREKTVQALADEKLSP
jgi:hypothetical protein